MHSKQTNIILIKKKIGAILIVSFLEHCSLALWKWNNSHQRIWVLQDNHIYLVLEALGLDFMAHYAPDVFGYLTTAACPWVCGPLIIL